MSERPVAIALFREAVVRFGEGKTTTATRLADRARELFLASGDIDGACAAALLRGRAAMRAARYADATEWFLWARDEANRRGLEPRVLAATSELAVLAELQGDALTAVAAHRSVLERQRARDDNLGIAMAAGNVARLLTKVAGHQPTIVAEARELLAEALQRFRDGPHEAGIANTLICIADLDRADGRLEEAMALFEEVVELEPTSGVQPMRLLAMHNLGNVLRQTGDCANAARTFLAAEALGDMLGDVRSARRSGVSRAVTAAQMGPLETAWAMLDKVQAGLEGSEDRTAEALVALHKGHLRAAAGLRSHADQYLREAGAYFAKRSDRAISEEIDIARAAVSLLGDSDQRAQKEARRRKSATPALARERLLLRAQLAFRRLDFGAFDTTLARLDRSQSWQENVAIGAVYVVRTALIGDDTAAGLDPLLVRAKAAGAQADLMTLKLAQTYASLWLGDLKRAESLALDVQVGADALGRTPQALEARMIYAIAGGRAVVASPWHKQAAFFAAYGAHGPAAWALGAAALATLDDDLLQLQLRNLSAAGDEWHNLVFLLWRAAYGPRDLTAMAVEAFENRGLFVPPWLRAIARG